MKLKLQFIIVAIIVSAIYSSVVNGQENLTFSGGNGSPLTITLQQSVAYTINNTQCNPGGGPVFIFDETGSPFVGFPSVTGTITYSISGGPPNAINLATGGINRNDISANDIGLSGSVPGASNGFTVILNAGTVTTTTLLDHLKCKIRHKTT